MKKYILHAAIIALGAIALSSCKKATLGSNPGSDSNPVVTSYPYALTGSRGTGLPPYNPDEDVHIRFAPNDKVKEYYYLAQLKVDRDLFVKQHGGTDSLAGCIAYNDYVIANGVKVTGNAITDVNMTLPGIYSITTVGIDNGGNRYATQSIFNGLGWTTIATGTYTYKITFTNGWTPSTATITLQVCTTNPFLYRFKDLYAVGYSLKLTGLKDYVKGPDGSGNTYIYCRITPQSTPFTSTSGGNTYATLVRDVGYWQGSDSFITTGGYESGICLSGPAKNSAYISPQYYRSIGSFGYGSKNNANGEKFVPN